MNLHDYEFNVGDVVITTNGETGKIVDVCHCEACERRSFYEPTWVSDENGSECYISDYTAKHGFEGYYQIGKHRFHKLNKESVLRSLEYNEKWVDIYKKRLKKIEELEAAEAEKAEKLAKRIYGYRVTSSCDKKHIGVIYASNMEEAEKNLRAKYNEIGIIGVYIVDLAILDSDIREFCRIE